MVRLSWLLIAALLFAVPAYTADLTGKPVIIDGDTIKIAGERIRLHGIDAPETDQTCKDEKNEEWPCGQEAMFALTRIVEFHWVRCEGKRRDKYRRLIAKCFVGPYDIEAKMVSQGWALAYRNFSMDYVEEEAEAKKHKRGLWRGEFVPPWQWRQGKRSIISETPAACCKVCQKGKACGNNCIQQTYTCFKLPGCACNGQ